jgi:hypothetical protein
MHSCSETIGAIAGALAKAQAELCRDCPARSAHLYAHSVDRSSANLPGFEISRCGADNLHDIELGTNC